MLNIAVCDDNLENIELIEKIIKKSNKFVCKLSSHTSALSLFSYLEDSAKGNIDVIFMDIELGEYNGIQVAAKIKVTHPYIKIIFVTGHINYAEDIFAVEPVYFIVKPISQARVLEALDKVYGIIQNENSQTIKIKNKQGIFKIKTSSIHYMESNKRIVYVYDAEQIWEVQVQLNELSKELPNNFLRCHQSYMVNMDMIKTFTSNGIELQSGKIIPISRLKYSEAKIKFLNYLGDKA